MARVAVTKKDSIDDQLQHLHQQIAQRAYELFRARDALWGDPWADWFAAEQELVWKPAVELREKDGTLIVLATVAGADPKDVLVDITPYDVAIKGTIERTHSRDDGQVHQSEFRTGRIFRSIHFPKPVDVAKAKAGYRNGLLTITAPIRAEAQAKRIDVEPSSRALKTAPAGTRAALT